jgi:hypothetical protein
MTRRKFHGQDPQILRATVQNIARGDLTPLPLPKYKYTCIYRRISQNVAFCVFTLHSVILKHPPELNCHPKAGGITLLRNVGTNTLHSRVPKPRTATARARKLTAFCALNTRTCSCISVMRSAARTVRPKQQASCT